jgi:hypothetical protein
MISKEAIEEFQTIYRKTFGQDISLIEAESKALALLRLYKAVLKTTDSRTIRKQEDSL